MIALATLLAGIVLALFDAHYLVDGGPDIANAVGGDTRLVSNSPVAASLSNGAIIHVPLSAG
jgi:hypothetical protein